jgi:HEAT repeat protein
MKQGSRYFLLTLVLAFGLQSAGCAGSWLSKHMPWSATEESIPGIKTADQRIEELKEIAKQAPTKPPVEQEAISKRLAVMIEKEKDHLVREQILTTLAVYPTPLAARVLSAGMNDPEPDVRISCCRAWAKRGGHEAAERLSHSLINDNNFDVRLAAARGLGKVKDRSAVQPLADALADSDPAMQYRAIESLKVISGKDYGNDLEAWRQYAKNGQNGDSSNVAKSWWQRWF